MDEPVEYASLVEQDSEDDIDWEEVQVPEHQGIEITINFSTKADSNSNTKKGISYAERLLRIDCHKIHTITLLANARVRNKWINDELLHARLLSLTPLPLQNAFAMIHKSRVPDQNQRGRMFEGSVRNLAEWWSMTYFEVAPEGHIRNRTFDEVQLQMVAKGFVASEGSEAKVEEIADLETLQDILDEDGEKIRGSKSLMKHALMASGSRDTSAQLFTALCRALGIPARLVVSLQSVPWKSSIGKPRPAYGKKGKGKADANEGTEDKKLVDVRLPPNPRRLSNNDQVKGKGKAKGDEDSTPDDEQQPQKSEKAKGKEKAKPIIKLRKSRPSGKKLGSASGASTPRSSSLPPAPTASDPLVTPPVFWTEVFSRPDARWIPVDPIRGLVNKRKIFDPTPQAPGPSQAPKSVSIISSHLNATKPPRQGLPRGVRQDNRMLYVLAFEEDGYARDVTRRYAREYGAKVAKAQGGNINGGGKGRAVWWESVVAQVTRPYRLHRDDVEDEELNTAQLLEGMPTTMAGFKDHPLYVLTRHLKQNQTLHPPPPETRELGKFRGEPVYSRSAVVSLKTSENWLRSEGRMIKSGCQPLKFVKLRPGTVNRMRELEVLKDGLKEAGSSDGANGGEMMQGLYARNQTEIYQPPPVIDGIVPKNNFGNVDLYVPSMLPNGAVHIPYKGIAKIARKLGFDYGEAVTGFEFKKRRAFPVIEGIVVAKENEAVLLEAYWEAQQDAEEKARIKREERVIKRWTRLIHGLRVRKRLQEQYARPENDQPAGPSTNAKDSSHQDGDSGESSEVEKAGGGFLVEAGDVVQAFHLPRQQLIPTSAPPSSPTIKDRRPSPTPPIQHRDEDPRDPSPVLDFETMDVDPENLPDIPTAPDPNLIPKTMQELAEAAEARQGQDDASTMEVEELPDLNKSNTQSSPPPLQSRGNRGKSTPGGHGRGGRRAPKARSTRVDVARASGPSFSKSKGATTLAANESGKGKGTRRASARKRRRNEDESDLEDEMTAEDVNGDDDAAGVAATPSSSVKRARKALAETPAPSTRTLRPRKAKDTSKTLQVKELDQMLDTME
ncbi:Rad4-domain-containing protein [Pluteus cervinus]|uniref:Rad4-domain-containing protein n=1 Tax=Pluteus cervinus TaxID=181527 RepID=A0ACD3ABL2_9AGAR|nr:Rad4-domain-containing protein [Pluteus cervinus]